MEEEAEEEERDRGEELRRPYMENTRFLRTKRETKKRYSSVYEREFDRAVYTH